MDNTNPKLATMLSRYKYGLKSHFAQASVFSIKVAGAGLAILLNAAVSRTLSLHDAGIFFAAFSFITISYAVARMGFGYATSKFVAQYFSTNQMDKLIGVSIISITCVFLFSLIIADLISYFVPIASSYGMIDNSASRAIFAFSCAIPLFCVTSIILEIIKGMRHPVAFALSDSIVLKTSTLICVYVGAISHGLYGAVYGYVLSFAVSLVFSSLLLRHLTKFINYRCRPKFEIRDTFKSVTYFAVLSIGTVLGQWIAPIIVSSSLSNESSALYFTAYRTSAVVEFVLISASAVIAPNFIQTYLQCGIDELFKSARNSAASTFFAAGCIAVPMIAFSGSLMSFYGDQFSSANSVLRILVVSQWLTAPAGVYLYLLIAIGCEKAIAAITIISSAAGILLVFVLSSYYGLAGAAFGQGAFMILQNVAVLGFALLLRRRHIARASNNPDQSRRS